MRQVHAGSIPVQNLKALLRRAQVMAPSRKIYALKRIRLSGPRPRGGGRLHRRDRAAAAPARQLQHHPAHRR